MNISSFFCGIGGGKNCQNQMLDRNGEEVKQCSLATVPTEVLRIKVLPFLKMKDLVRLDSAVANSNLRKYFEESLIGGNIHKPIGIEQLVWLTRRKCFVDSLSLTSACNESIINTTLLESVKTIKDLTIGFKAHISAQLLTTMINSNHKMKELTCQSSLIDWENWQIHSVLSLVEINISGNVTDQFMTRLLEHSPHLQVLKVSRGRLMTPHTLRAVAKFCAQLRELDALTTLYSDDMTLHLQYESAMHTILMQCPQLTTLHASIVSTDGFFPANENLQLSLVHVDWSCDAEMAVNDKSSAIAKMARCCPKIEKLKLFGFQGTTDDGLHAVAQHLSHLRSFTLFDSDQFTDTGVRAVRNACTNLEYLDIHGCYRVYGASLASGPSGVLHHVHLYNMYRFSNANFLHGIQHNASLRVLRVGFMCTRDYDTDLVVVLSPETIARAIALLVHLTEFEFTMSQWNTSGKRCIDDSVLHALAQHCPKLNKLSLDSCHSATSAGFQALSRLKQLRSLRLDNCPGLDSTAVCDISADCRDLQSVSFQGCVNVTRSGVQALAVHCRYLQWITIAGCSYIRDADVVALIRSSPDLKMLYVGKSYFLTSVVTTLPRVMTVSY